MQTANLDTAAADFRLVEVLLALELFFADAVRFIPMDFSESNPAVPQPYARAAFHLPPVAPAIQAPKSSEIANSATGCDRLDVGEVANKYEVHLARILGSSDGLLHRF